MYPIESLNRPLPSLDFIALQEASDIFGFVFKLVLIEPQNTPELQSKAIYQDPRRPLSI